MQKLHYEIVVNAPAEKAYDQLLGLSDKSSYQQWTAAFNPTSTFEGSWEKGSKMLFLGTDENGKRGGMVSRIADNIPGKFVSIEHYGILDGDTEITEGPQVQDWAGGLENYTFTEDNNQTTIAVDIDAVESFQDYFNNTFPKALNKLKELIEA